MMTRDAMMFSWMPEILLILCLSWVFGTAWMTTTKLPWTTGTRRLGSKGSYASLNVSEAALRVSPLPEATRCRTMYAAAVTRHGSRYPSASMKAAVLALRRERCGSVLASAVQERLSEWCAATGDLEFALPGRKRVL